MFFSITNTSKLKMMVWGGFVWRSFHHYSMAKLFWCPSGPPSSREATVSKSVLGCTYLRSIKWRQQNQIYSIHWWNSSDAEPPIWTCTPPWRWQQRSCWFYKGCSLFPGSDHLFPPSWWPCLDKWGAWCKHRRLDSRRRQRGSLDTCSRNRREILALEDWGT